MIEWSIFYKMLGIPEDVTEPTYYDLLGLHPNICNSALVDRMLNKQKSRLRQNIPGPQFIPLVLSFEQKKLDRAAAVLRDPAVREKYNTYLQRKARLRKREKQKEKARQRLLQKARDAVDALLNPDKTLDDSKRPILGAKLRSLGLKESRVNSLLERIPRPAKEVARPGDEAMQYFVAAIDLAIRGGLLTPDAERKIMDLAEKLNIDEEQAINRIDQELADRNARRGERDVSVLEREFENRVRTMFPNGSATSDQYQLLLALAEADGLPETAAKGVLQRCLVVVMPKPIDQESPAESAEPTGEEQPIFEDRPEESDTLVAIPVRTRRRDIWPIALPIIAIAVFVFFVWFLQMGGRESLFRRRSPVPAGPPTGPRVSPGPPIVYQSDPKPPSRPVRQPKPLDEQSAPKPPARIRGPCLVTANDVRQHYSSTTQKDELFSDLAMTMFACYCRAVHFTTGSTNCYDELSKLMQESDRAGYLTQSVTVTPAAPVRSSGSPAEASEPEARESRPKGPFTEYSIEALRVQDTPEAADKLLDELKKQSLRPPRGTIVCRTLWALSTMTDSDIPRRLIDMLPESQSLVAILIARTLDKAAGSSASAGLLTWLNGPADREKCAEYWNSHCPTWAGSSSVHPSPSGGGSSRWEPDPMIIKLLAVTAQYAELTADVLKDYRYNAGPPAQARGRITNTFPTSCTPAGVGPKLLDSLNNIFVQLARLVVENPDRGQFDSDSVGRITRYQKALREVACETKLQKAVVHLDSTAGLLELLVQQSRPTEERKQELVKIEADRQSALRGCHDVVDELRESCYYNLVLWDLLIGGSDDPVPVTPAPTSVRRSR